MAAPPVGKEYLADLVNKNLHVTTTDGRIFVGQLKCTDRERNIILSMTQEYKTLKGNADAASDNIPPEHTQKRFVGLIVVPGQYITKIELET